MSDTMIWLILGSDIENYQGWSVPGSEPRTGTGTVGLEPEPITILEEPRTEPGTETDKFIDTNIL